MPLPEMPWYSATEKLLEPVDPYTRWLLVALALGLLYVAWKGDAVARTGLFVYMVSP